MKKKIITIAGNAGSGKSSTADGVAEILDYDRFSSGDFMRAVAESRGVTLEKLHAMAEEDPSIDHEIDKQNMKMGERENIVIDSRLAFHFIPYSFKVFLSLDPDVAAKRIFKDKQESSDRDMEEETRSKEEVRERIEERMQSNRRRYKELYDIDYLDESQFDLVIDTDENTLEQVVKEVVKEYKNWCDE